MFRAHMPNLGIYLFHILIAKINQEAPSFSLFLTACKPAQNRKSLKAQPSGHYPPLRIIIK